MHGGRAAARAVAARNARLKNPKYKDVQTEKQKEKNATAAGSMMVLYTVFVVIFVVMDLFLINDFNKFIQEEGVSMQRVTSGNFI